MQALYRHPTKRRDAAARHRPDEPASYSFRDVSAAIASEGGPALMREVWKKFGGAVYPAESAAVTRGFYVSLELHRRRFIVPLEAGATVTRPDEVTPVVWREIGRPLVALGYLDAPDLATYRRTDKPGPVPITPGDVMGETQRAKHRKLSLISSRQVREAFVCNAEVGQVIERPASLLPESWRIAVQPLCRLGFFEAVARGDDKFHAVKRLPRGKRVPFDNYEINAMCRKRFGREAVTKS